MKKKSLIMLLSAMLVIATAAMGTIAYLTDSKSVTNTFTVGNVIIDVDETVVDENGDPVDADEDGTADRTTDDQEGGEGNEYHLIPGEDYTKDPTVTVKANSEESYIRMLVGITDIEDVKINVKAATGKDFMPGDYVDGYDPEKWIYVGETEGKVADSPAAIYEFRYYKPVSTMPADGTEAQDITLEALFTSFTVPGELNGDQLAAIADMKVIVVGQAIQTATFTDSEDGTMTAEDAAWAALEAQLSKGVVI